MGTAPAPPHERCGAAQLVSNHVYAAVAKREDAAYDKAFDDAWEAHEAQGGTEDDWEEPLSFDWRAARQAGQTLAQNAVSRDPDVFQAACAEIESLGLDVLDLMSEAYRSYEGSVKAHENKLPDLERRRREVMRDFEALQKARPLEAKVIEG